MEKVQVILRSEVRGNGAPLPPIVFAVTCNHDREGWSFDIWGGGASHLTWRGQASAPPGPMSTYRADMTSSKVGEAFMEWLVKNVGLQAEMELLDP